MKTIMMVVAATLILASCNTNNQVQIIYPDGKVEWAENDKSIPVQVGDSVVVQHYTSLRTIYSSDKLHGYWRGSLPSTYSDSLCIFYYNYGVVIDK